MKHREKTEKGKRNVLKRAQGVEEGSRSPHCTANLAQASLSVKQMKYVTGEYFNDVLSVITLVLHSQPQLAAHKCSF